MFKSIITAALAFSPLAFAEEPMPAGQEPAAPSAPAKEAKPARAHHGGHKGHHGHKAGAEGASTEAPSK